MANIVVCGCSWSSTQFSTFPLDWQSPDHYPAHLSISNRLRALGHRVYESSSPGASVSDQLDALNRYITTQQNANWAGSVDYIVFGWTELMRDSRQMVTNKNLNYQVQEPLDRDYNSEYARIQTQITDQLERVSSLMPRHRWLHWGGLSTVWAKRLPKRHSVLFNDYTHEVLLDNPRGVHDLYSFAPRGLEFDELYNWLQRIFPGTPIQQARAMSKDIAENWANAFTEQKLDLYPDSGHLAFKHYDVLVNTIHAHITSKPVPKLNFRKPQELDTGFVNIFKKKKKK